MKRFKVIGLLSLGMSLISLSGYSQTNYTVKGKISGWPTETVYLVRQGDYEGVDSVKTKDGSFEFKGNIEGPTVAYLITQKKGGVAKLLFVEPGTITVNGDFNAFKEAQIEGSKTYKDFLEFQNGHQQIGDQINQLLSQQNNAADEDEMNAITNSLDSLNVEELNFSKKFISDHPNSIISLNEIAALRGSLEKSVLLELFNSLGEKVRKSPTGLGPEESLQNTDPGQLTN